MFQHQPDIRVNKQEAELLSLLVRKKKKKKKQCFEHTLLSSLQQNQGVISHCVESKADHGQGFVHVAPQSGR